MNGHDGRKMRELLLMGEAWSGKSTTFNAICDGREISPRGVGIKATGCRISAHPIPADVEEYAELTWKTDDELMLAMYDIVSDNLVDDKDGRTLFPHIKPEKLPSLSDNRVRALSKKAIHAEWEKYCGNVAVYDRVGVDRLDLLQIATLILEYGTLMLGELRAQTRVSLDDVKSLVAFPRDWSVKWQKEGENVHWRLKDVACVFLSGVDCHVHSPTLERLGCVVTDCPGFFEGPWGAKIAQQAMMRANAILYLIGGQKQMCEADRQILSEIRKIEQGEKVVFAINAKMSKLSVEQELRSVDFDMVKEASFPIEREEDICVFNALLALNAKTSPSDQEKAWMYKKTVGRTLSQYLDLDPLNGDDMSRIRNFMEKPMELYKVSGLETVLDGVLDGMGAATRVPGRHLEIALIGEFQNGKSTIFNAMLDGRDLSPRGVNAKRSACTITACALSRGRKEYAEFEWRSDALLDEIVAIGSASDGVGGEDVPRLAKLISRFRNVPELTRLRKRRKMPIEEAQRLLVYPVDWEPRWQQDGSGGAFEFAQIAWVFIGRVKYHIHSKVLDRLDCDLTDSPGFGDGEWDEALARAAILRADVLVCVLDRRKSMSSDSSYFRRLSWIQQVNKNNSVLYALNAETSREHAEEWRKTNVSTIRQKGIGVEEWQMPAFNAELGRHAAKMRSADGGVSLKNVRGTLIKWLNLDPYYNDSDCVRMNDLCANPRQMSREAGFDDFICAVQRAVSDFREKEGKGQVCFSPILIQEDGTPIPDNGFVWNDDSSFVSRLMKGAKWKEGLFHPNCPNVVSSTKSGTWNPAPGYAWVDETSWMTKWQKGVKWKEGLFHPNCPNVVSSTKSGTWNPAPGYAWVDETSWMTKWQKGVKWKAGLRHPRVPHIYADAEEGIWCADPGYTFREKGHAFAGVEWQPGYKRSSDGKVAGDVEGDWENPFWYWLTH